MTFITALRLTGAGMLAILVTGCVGASVVSSTGAVAQSLPEIRLSPRNQVPRCVTPPRLMRFLAERNSDLPPRFRNIADHYQAHGERLGVRWDYAFFQMILETNYLKFRNNSGQGDVDPSQNNFAGIGTTGGGVPGNRFPDVSTGVLAQMQHLIAYSGEHVPNPVAQRTRDKQDDIIALSRQLRRPVTFRDLAGRWAIDRRYARSIATIAERFNDSYCSGRQVADEPRERGIETRVAGAAAGVSGLGAASVAPLPRIAPERTTGAPTEVARPGPCRVFTASYGGEKNVLIRRQVGDEMHYTALQVIDGREQGLSESFIRRHAEGGEAIAEHPSREAALSHAFSLCPSAAGGRG